VQVLKDVPSTSGRRDPGMAGRTTAIPVIRAIRGPGTHAGEITLNGKRRRAFPRENRNSGFPHPEDRWKRVADKTS
jgi:hypothetical protein